ncbi:MAG: hypothetical protein HPY57_01425 [Ignavibacteria bacterium]|nr:hypothetical protein [Ignavibacteria bacterium]
MANQWVYKVIPLPRNVTIMRKLFEARLPEDITAGYVEKIINDMAQQGWEFYRADECTIVERPGCLGSLLGRRESAYTYNMLVFRRQASA